MRKNKVDDFKLIKFKVKYKLIFLNSKFDHLIKNHFDKKCGFTAFLIGFLENRIGDKKLLKHLKINLDEWLDLLFDIYNDKDIIEAHEKLTFNPVIDFQSILKLFDCFDNVISKIIQYLEFSQLNLNIPEIQIKQMIKNAFSFILYNTLDCKMFYNFEETLYDPEYDQKCTMILNNTKLFAYAKKSILNNCGSNVNDLIVLLLGISKDMNHEKKLIDFKRLVE